MSVKFKHTYQVSWLSKSRVLRSRMSLKSCKLVTLSLLELASDSSWLFSILGSIKKQVIWHLRGTVHYHTKLLKRLKSFAFKTEILHSLYKIIRPIGWSFSLENKYTYCTKEWTTLFEGTTSVPSDQISSSYKKIRLKTKTCSCVCQPLPNVENN